MNQHEVKILFAFNAWATNRMFDGVAAMAPEQIARDMKTGHGSIFGTFIHMVSVEKNWVSRWTGKPETPLSAEDVPSLDKLRTLWNTAGFEAAKFVAGMTDKKLQELFEYKDTQGETRRQLYWQSMLHVVDHSTYHRGQIVCMMRQQGITPPATSMITFFRETAKLGK